MTDTTFPSELHKRLNIFAGVWDTRITMLLPNGDGETSEATDTYRWMPNGQHLVHEVSAIMGGQAFTSMEIFSVDAETQTFPSHSYDADGSVNGFIATIDGRALAIEGTRQRFSGMFNEDGNILSGEWRQLDGEQWLPFVRIELRRRL